jgi:choline dehydrogenase-like flavoprotein
MYIVVGSGPAGIACACGLLELGAQVTMLDIGVVCEPERSALVSRLRECEPEQWEEDARRRVSVQQLPATGQGFPVKLVFGSEFPYAPVEAVAQTGTRCVQSWAEGGLSTVWGAAMLPFPANELTDWPFGLDQLEPHYKAAARITGIAGRHDALEELHPYFGEPAPSLPASSQAQWILARLERNARRLRAQGFRFGQSRLAVRASRCRRCQLCLTGCVYDAIYSTAQTLRDLQRHPRFTYLRGVRVLRCDDAVEHSTVTYREIASGSTATISGRRTFVAAGVLATTRILLNSIGLREARLDLRFHPYFLAPMLMLSGSFVVSDEKLHALAQGFLEIVDPAISRHVVHTQLYTYNPLYRERIRAAGPIAKAVGSLLLGRLVALQGYLHSHESDAIEVRAFSDAPSGEIRLELAGSLGNGARRTMRRVIRKLARNAHLTGLVPLPFATQIGTPGDGNHIGCVFPMARDARGLQSDTLGRVRGLTRVHVVDASVFPSIPSTTITYTAMANAHRIAAAAHALDGNGK